MLRYESQPRERSPTFRAILVVSQPRTESVRCRVTKEYGLLVAQVEGGVGIGEPLEFVDRMSPSRSFEGVGR